MVELPTSSSIWQRMFSNSCWIRFHTIPPVFLVLSMWLLMCILLFPFIQMIPITYCQSIAFSGLVWSFCKKTPCNKTSGFFWAHLCLFRKNWASPKNTRFFFPHENCQLLGKANAPPPTWIFGSRESWQLVFFLFFLLHFLLWKTKISMEHNQKSSLVLEKNY